ncbi:hypothetical protein DER46DRAFT_207679 [Fusarium sp. MPI-SDFR-AT-0072]|nr:hypothetical protein DER46DRAFT_207679 [Fusarium sp. MPI-SDFR-AT-0072]
MILPCRRKLPSSDDATRPLPRVMKPGWASRKIRLRSVSRRFRSLLSPCSGSVRICEPRWFNELCFTNSLPLQLSLGSSSLVVSSSRVSPDSSVKLPSIEPLYYNNINTNNKQQQYPDQTSLSAMVLQFFLISGRVRVREPSKSYGQAWGTSP